MSLSTLKDIFSKTTFDDVWSSLIKQYPDIIQAEEDYKNVFSTLADLQPEDNTDKITIRIELVDEKHEEKWFAVYGKPPIQNLQTD